MRHRLKPTTHFRNRDWGHVDAMTRNLLTSFITHTALQTTQKKALILDRLFARLVNVINSKTEEQALREVMRYVYTQDASITFVRVIAPKYKDQNSGYTRILPVKYRAGDAAKLVQIELV